MVPARQRIGVIQILLLASLGFVIGCSNTPSSACNATLDQLMDCSGADWDETSQQYYVDDCVSELLEAETALPGCYDALLELGGCAGSLSCDDFEGIWEEGPCQAEAAEVFGDEECMAFYPF